MSTYKVPQDVEADDKILGPFSFRQFIYLIIVALAGALAWGLGQLFLPLSFIPLPVMVFFGALALPLRKDQPMETYLAAMISFYLKPRKRLWDPDGVDSLIEITAPRVAEIQRTKDFSQSEAERRLTYLADIVDSKGWAVRGPGIIAPDSPISGDIIDEAQQTQDIMDDDNRIAQSLDYKLDQSSSERHQQVSDIMSGQTDYFNGPTNEPITATETSTVEKLDFNPYPDIQQTVIQPLVESERLEDSATIQPKPTIEEQTTTSEKVPSPDIMNLVESGYSLETIAHQAERIRQRDNPNDEVVIRFR